MSGNHADETREVLTAVARDAELFQAREPRGEEFIHFAHHVGIGGVLLHRRGRALHVHEHVARAGFGDEASHVFVLAIRRDVVDETRAGAQRRGAGEGVAEELGEPARQVPALDVPVRGAVRLADLGLALEGLDRLFSCLRLGGSGLRIGNQMMKADSSRAAWTPKWNGAERSARSTTAGQWVRTIMALKSTSAGRNRASPVVRSSASPIGAAESAPPPPPTQDTDREAGHQAESHRVGAAPGIDHRVAEQRGRRARCRRSSSRWLQIGRAHV